jgi:amphi-Trp domain-containing protein
MSKSKLKLESRLPLDQAAARLEELAASLRSGQACFQAADEALTLCPGQVVDMEIKVAVKKDKEKVEIELSWPGGQPRAGEMNISAGTGEDTA